MSGKKVILVTGANKGIGLALVRVLLRDHSDTHLLLCSRDRERGEAAVAAVTAELGCSDRLELIILDVTSEESVQEAAATVRARHGKLFGLINNAGGTAASARATLELNTFSLIRVCQAFLPLLQPAGRIVQISSGAAPMFVAKCNEAVKQFLVDPDITFAAVEERLITPYLKIQEDAALSEEEKTEALASQGIGANVMGAYGLSKACVNAYTVELAKLTPHLMVNACTPGFIATDLVAPMAARSGKSMAELGAETDTEKGTVAAVRLLLGQLQPGETGQYYGSDGLRSPLHKYRSPGEPAYNGEFP